MNQSMHVYHIYTDSIDDIDYIDCEFDTRTKIEDLDKFKRELRDEVDEATFNKLDAFIDNYLKFENE